MVREPLSQDSERPVNERPDEEPYWHLLANELVKQWDMPLSEPIPAESYSRIPRWAYEWQHPERYNRN